MKEDGSTVYGELFGDPYAQWCAEFLMYCLKKAEDRLGTSYIDSVYPWYPSAYSCGLWFKAYFHYFDPGTYIPARGDMVLFDTYGIGYPDHIAMVVEVVDDGEGDPVIITIEGNILTDPVPQIRSRQLSCTDSAIFGYGSIRSANYGYDGRSNITALPMRLRNPAPLRRKIGSRQTYGGIRKRNRRFLDGKKEKKAIHERSGHIKSSCGFRIDCVKKDNALMFG